MARTANRKATRSGPCAEGHKSNVYAMEMDMKSAWMLGVGFLLLAGLCISMAANIDPVDKHAWTENTGWANCAPGGGGVTIHYTGTSGYLTGYAWGENIGWIKMGDDTGGPYGNVSAADWGVNLDGAGDLSGYAWGENVGWIRFASVFNRARIDLSTGRFDGYAWGENIGWIRFQGSAANYSVRTFAFETQPHGTPNWWLALHSIGDENDLGVKGYPAWQDWAADTDPNDPNSVFHIVSVSNTPHTAAIGFTPSSLQRYYTLQCRSNTIAGGWANVPGQISRPGTGGIGNLQDTNAPRSASFYAIQVNTTP